MAHFYGIIQGTRGEATRLGDKKNGLSTTVASWSGAIRVWLRHNKKTGKDEYHVEEIPWREEGVHRTIAKGVIGEPK